MQRVVYYDNGTDPATEPSFRQGEIVFVSDFLDTDTSTQFAARQPSYTAYLIDNTTDQDVTSETYYVNTSGTPTLTARPIISRTRDFEIFNDGTDEVRFSLPAGTVTSFDFTNAESTNVSTQDFVFTTTIYGAWCFTFEPPFPYAPLIIEITSNANV